MLSHTVEIVAEGHRANYGKTHGNEADPDKTVLIFAEAHIVLADIPVHAQSDLDRATTCEVELLQKFPAVAIVAHLDICRVVHLESPSKSEVEYIPQPRLHLRVWLG